MNHKQFLQSLAAPFLWAHHHLLPRGSVAEWTAYLWLCWLALFFVDTPAPATLIATIAAIAIFLPLYFRCFWAGRRERLLIIGAVAALGFALIPFNASGGGFLIYAGAFIGFSLARPRDALIALAVLAATGSIEYLLLGFSFIQWFWVPMVTLVIGMANVWNAERHRQLCALRQSQDEVKRLAATAERERIGRDLHDLLGHTLTLITVKAELAARMAERNLAGAAREIREVESVSRNALQQVREAVGGYRASGGLMAELGNARTALSSAHIGLDEKITAPNLSAPQDSLLAMVLREAVTNVIRHAGARHCRIEVESRGRHVRMVVSDDGHGGDVREGNGLKGMRERLQKVAGRLDITSGRQGTRLSIRMPLTSAMPEGASPLEGESA